jgi:hypothetical protein
MDYGLKAYESVVESLYYVKNSTIRKNSKIGKEENQECIFYMRFYLVVLWFCQCMRKIYVLENHD